MIKKIFFTLTTAFLLSMQLQAHDETKLFSGSIEFPYALNFDLCLFYQGQKLDFEHSTSSPFVQFSFLDSKDTHTVYLLITNGLTCRTQESNTIQCLCIVDDSAYICYKLQAKRELHEDEHQLLTWEICEHRLQNGQIPQNSLIFLFEPSLIAGLKVQSWKPENLFRIIPTLVIHPTATQKQVERAMMVARLAALDIDAIHAKNSGSTQAILTAMQ